MNKKEIAIVLDNLNKIFPSINDWSDSVNEQISTEEAKDKSSEELLDKLYDQLEGIGQFNDKIEQAITILERLEDEAND